MITLCDLCRYERTSAGASKGSRWRGYFRILTARAMTDEAGLTGQVVSTNLSDFSTNRARP
jgi:hypothetical protein